MSICQACSFTIDDGDNFCRRCGAAVGSPRLPAVHAAATPTVWRPQASPVVKGAAVMAAGTVGQFVFRRLVGGLLSGAGRSKKQRAVRARDTRGDGMIDEAQIITETIMMRRVRVRRQA
jgi:hypothetical protein